MDECEVEPLRSSQAGVLTSVSRANGFVIISRGNEGLGAGTEVEVILHRKEPEDPSFR